MLPNEPQNYSSAPSGSEVRERSHHLSNILVAVDFSSFSKWALDYAQVLATKSDAKITIIHVVEPMIVPETLMVTTDMKMDMRMVQKRQEVLESLRRDKINPAIPCEAIEKNGVPWEQIVEEAKLIHSELIITASHGRSVMEDILLGNTAEKVVRNATCSVLTVRHSMLYDDSPLASEIRVKKILVPIDFSVASEKALAKAVVLAKLFEAEIILAHVIETNPVQAAFGHMPKQVQAAEPEEVLARFGQQNIPANIRRQIVVRVGTPYKAIAELATTMHVDLVVITSHGHNILEWTLLGGTAERVIRHAPCSIWTIRE